MHDLQFSKDLPPNGRLGIDVDQLERSGESMWELSG